LVFNNTKINGVVLRFLIFLPLLFAQQVVYSQVVTSSFDPTFFNLNPASNSSRVFGGVFTAAEIKKIDVNGTEIGDNPDITGLTNQNANWDVEDKLTSFKVMYADKKAWGDISPEILFVKQSLATEWIRTDNTGTDPVSTLTADKDVLNLHTNIAYQLNLSLSFGLHAAVGTIKQTDSDRYTFNSITNSEDRKIDNMLYGGGLGVSGKLPGNFYLGGSFFVYALSQEADVVQNNQSFKQENKYTFTGYNFGVAYQWGELSGTTLKSELSYRGNSVEVTSLKNGSRAVLSFEAMTKKYYANGSLSRVTGDSIVFQDVIGAFMNERISSNEAKLEYSISGGFRTTAGHSFGAMAMYSKVNSNRFDSTYKSISASVSYSFIFQ
jgi:hypothetical protein